MAHFARIQDSIVQQVIVVDNSVVLDSDGNEQESLGIAFCRSLFGATGVWLQTSYNGNLRKNYAGIGDKYDLDRDAFIGPQPYASWLLNEATCRWEAPIPSPGDSNVYDWDESTLLWIQVVEP